jgi:predicted acyltransferase (DUF342 family)
VIGEIKQKNFFGNLVVQTGAIFGEFRGSQTDLRSITDIDFYVKSEIRYDFEQINLIIRTNLAQVVAFLFVTCFLEVLSSNPGWNTENPDFFVVYSITPRKFQDVTLN